MRKWVISLICTFLLTGCFMQKEDSTVYAAYEGYYKSIEDNDKFIGSSLYYTLSAEITTLADGSHRYYIFLDNAQIAMYDVVLLAVENEIPMGEAKKMMPSIGIFEKMDYSLIPYQSRIEKGFVKGLVISGETSEDTVSVRMLVEWRDKNKENAHREYIAFNITDEGLIPTEISGSADEGAADE